jgi:hypothetical protein
LIDKGPLEAGFTSGVWTIMYPENWTGD